ncbi:MAG TPA: tetraacyldisaccharide 4'-kinase [Burkholderiales bacterium]|nr:tetraacyldisaccharide 4'-kinase [Burkholderiales bacterium]
MDGSTSFPERHWYRLSALSVALAPFGLAFRLVVGVRRAAFAAGILKSHRLPVPVVVVGNLVVGGTGKTPLVLWVVDALRSRGRRPGIVSRGYRGTNDPARPVPSRADPAHFGDEPVLLAERSGVPVWIGRDRVAAARGLLAAHPDCDVLVCDDGLQHYALARDVEIAVEDERGHGNGLLLPAGPLREPASRAVDAVVVNGPPRAGAFEMRLVPAGFRRVGGDGQEVPIEALRGKRLHAVAGIGNPPRFFATLRALGLAFVPHAFPDHHPWMARDLVFTDCDAILMTEKDEVKCRAFGRDDLVALRVEARVDPRLADLLSARVHGPQAA